MGTSICRQLGKFTAGQSVGSRIHQRQNDSETLEFDLLCGDVRAKKGGKLRSAGVFFFKLPCLNVDGTLSEIRASAGLSQSPLEAHSSRTAFQLACFICVYKYSPVRVCLCDGVFIYGLCFSSA